MIPMIFNCLNKDLNGVIISVCTPKTTVVLSGLNKETACLLSNDTFFKNIFLRNHPIAKESLGIKALSILQTCHPSSCWKIAYVVFSEKSIKIPEYFPQEKIFIEETRPLIARAIQSKKEVERAALDDLQAQMKESQQVQEGIEGELEILKNQNAVFPCDTLEEKIAQLTTVDVQEKREFRMLGIKSRGKKCLISKIDNSLKTWSLLPPEHALIVIYKEHLNNSFENFKFLDDYPMEKIQCVLSCLEPILDNETPPSDLNAICNLIQNLPSKLVQEVQRRMTTPTESLERIVSDFLLHPQGENLLMDFYVTLYGFEEKIETMYSLPGADSAFKAMILELIRTA